MNEVNLKSHRMTIQERRNTPRGHGKDATATRMPALVRWTLYVFLFSLCFENFDPFDIFASFTITKMVGILFALACFWQVPSIFTNQHWTVRLLAWLWLVLAGATILAELAHPVVRSAFSGVLFSLAQCFLVYWLCTNVLRDWRTAAYGLLTFAASAALLSVLMKLGIGRVALRESAEFERVSFLGANSNIIAIWAATGIIIITELVTGNILRWGIWRYGLLVFVAPMLVVMMESGSRGAAISLFLGMACFLFASGSAYKRLYIGLAAIGVCLGMFYLSKGSVLADRMQRTVDTGTMAGREELWPAALKMIQQKPLLGWGMWNPEDYNESPCTFLGELQGADPHNVFLGFFVFGGILVGLPFLGMSGWWLYVTLLRRRGRWGMIPLALTVFMLSTMFKAGGFYVMKIPWIALAFANAAILPYGRKKTQRSHQTNRRTTRVRDQQPVLTPEPVSCSIDGPPLTQPAESFRSRAPDL
jgi:O-antigen ligase